MKQSSIIIIVIVVVLGVAGLVIATGSKEEPSNSPGDMSATMDMPSSTPSSAMSSMQEDLTNQSEVTMDIKDFAFSKTSIKIKKGTTVTWTNQDDAKHDISPTDGADDFEASELLAKGESYSSTFDKVGEYSYKCSPHPYMKGMITVIE